MLSAQLFVLGKVVGSDGVSNQVTIGLVIEESDTSLPHRNVAGSLKWGDSSAPFTIAAQASPYNSASAVELTFKSNVIIVTINPPAYKGTFQLKYNGTTNTSALDFDATADDIQTAVSAVLSTGETVVVDGVAPQWTLTFDSSATAGKISTGPDTLFGPVVLTAHSYPDGNFLLTFTANNFRSPVQDVASVTEQLTLNAAVTQANPQPILIGPILAADVGAPNANQWNFNISTDLQVLVSNVKMILIVEPGERLMMPEYGTALRQFIFNPMDGTIAADAQTEIKRAIATWEPRVSVDSINVTPVDQRTLKVQITAVSKLDQQRFQLNVELER